MAFPLTINQQLCKAFFYQLLVYDSVWFIRQFTRALILHRCLKTKEQRLHSQMQILLLTCQQRSSSTALAACQWTRPGFEVGLIYPYIQNGIKSFTRFPAATYIQCTKHVNFQLACIGFPNENRSMPWCDGRGELIKCVYLNGPLFLRKSDSLDFPIHSNEHAIHSSESVHTKYQNHSIESVHAKQFSLVCSIWIH